MQNDRDELQSANEELQEQVQELQEQVRALSSPLRTRSPSVERAVAPIPGGTELMRRPGTPRTHQLREELERARVALEHERTVLDNERREATRLRQELQARRDREKRMSEVNVISKIPENTLKYLLNT